jgi:predicted nucleotidyltransferase
MNIADLLRSLNEHNVKYVLIGAMAFSPHGFSRATRDVDILIEPTEENVQRTMHALVACGYDLSDLKPEEMLEKKILLRQYILETDIHPSVGGVTFKDVWKHKVREKLYDIPANFASLDDLIKMKRAAGRPKDKEDLKYLLHIRKIKRKSKR